MIKKGGKKSTVASQVKKPSVRSVAVKRSGALSKTPGYSRLAIVKKPTKSMIGRPLSDSTIQLSTLHRDFISAEKNDFRYSLGNVVASSFSGFVAGIVVSSLIWVLIVNVLFLG